MYKRSITDLEGFWREQGKRIDWFKPYTKVKNTSFDEHNVSIKWYEDGVTNVAYNCIDRHLAKRANQTAIIWEGDDPSRSKHITYAELADQVGRFANVLKAHGVKKGDRVTLYLPMIPEAAYAMLACSRIGAIHSVVLTGFSPNALAGRIADAELDVVITADEGLRGGRKIPLKANTDIAVKKAAGVRHVMVVKHTDGVIDWTKDRDVWLHEAVKAVTAYCPPEPMNADDPLFILYTAGSTAAPKGVVHSTGGYLVFASITHQYVFDYHEGDIYWCTADFGCITGHSYTLYGPLANGATTLMFEGVPKYPTMRRLWEIVDKHKVNILYTAPSVICSLMAAGEEPVKKTGRRSLRLLGSFGEPVNPEAWEWYHRVVGERRCPIVETWAQTESGGILMASLPDAMQLMLCSATRPFFGVMPEIVDVLGKVLGGVCQDNLVFANSWPGQMGTIYGDQSRLRRYFDKVPNKYFAYEVFRRDVDGYYWVVGRADDVISVSGHHISTSEVESALAAHPDVAEVAVVGFPHKVKGEGIYAYVTVMAGVEPTEELRKELVARVRKEIGPIASPDLIHFTSRLPKLVSGKVLISTLRKIAAREHVLIHATIADPSVVYELMEEVRQNLSVSPKLVGAAVKPIEPYRPRIFISYGHADEPEKEGAGDVRWLSFVTTYLRPAQKQGAVHLWTDSVITGGADWDPEIEKNLRDCDIFILLVSPASLSSDYIVDKELSIIRDRQTKGESVHFYPILLKPTPEIALKLIQDKNLRPRNKKPLSDFSQNERYSVMNEIANEIVVIANGVAGDRGEATANGRSQRFTSLEQTFPISNIPISVPRHFLGRDAELASIDAALKGERGRVAVLHGLRGVGKTTLAAAYARHHSQEYLATWWVRAQTPEAIRSDLVALGVRLGWLMPDDKEQPALEKVREHLLRRSRRAPDCV